MVSVLSYIYNLLLTSGSGRTEKLRTKLVLTETEILELTSQYRKHPKVKNSTCRIELQLIGGRLNNRTDKETQMGNRRL